MFNTSCSSSFLVGTPRRGVQGGRAAAQHYLVADGIYDEIQSLCGDALNHALGLYQRRRL
jgi:hypothetical protein